MPSVSSFPCSFFSPSLQFILSFAVFDNENSLIDFVEHIFDTDENEKRAASLPKIVDGSNDTYYFKNKCCTEAITKCRDTSEVYVHGKEDNLKHDWFLSNV